MIRRAIDLRSVHVTGRARAAPFPLKNDNRYRPDPFGLRVRSFIGYEGLTKNTTTGLPFRPEIRGTIDETELPIS